MFSHTDRALEQGQVILQDNVTEYSPDARTSSTMRTEEHLIRYFALYRTSPSHRKGLVEVKMANIATANEWICKTDLSIQIRACGIEDQILEAR